MSLMSTSTLLKLPKTNLYRDAWNYKYFDKGSWVVHGQSAGKMASECVIPPHPPVEEKETIELYAPKKELHYYSLGYLKKLEKKKNFPWPGELEILNAWEELKEKEGWM